MKKIEDTFSDLPLSRQRRYQLRKRAQGRCRTCGGASKKFVECKTCAKASHVQKGSKRYNSTSPRIKAAKEFKARVAGYKKREPVNPWLIKEPNDSGRSTI